MKKLITSVYFLVLFTIIICQSSYADVYYPHVASNNRWGTEICAINTGSGTVTGTFEAYDDNGNSVSSGIAVTLAGNARREITVGDDFDDLSDIGYIIFESDSEQASLPATCILHTLPAMTIGGPALVFSIQWQQIRI